MSPLNACCGALIGIAGAIIITILVSVWYMLEPRDLPRRSNPHHNTDIELQEQPPGDPEHPNTAHRPRNLPPGEEAEGSQDHSEGTETEPAQEQSLGDPEHANTAHQTQNSAPGGEYEGLEVPQHYNEDTDTEPTQEPSDSEEHSDNEEHRDSDTHSISTTTGNYERDEAPSHPPRPNTPLDPSRLLIAQPQPVQLRDHGNPSANANDTGSYVSRLRDQHYTNP
ncbi:MAG: hypothetical protein Q9160_001816 [Pyrenula sp. 1 TL-2023]